MTISFTGGLVKTNNSMYINPDNIQFFEKNENNGTTIHFNSTGNMQNDWQTVRINVKCSPDKFAEAVISAEKTGAIIDLDA